MEVTVSSSHIVSATPCPSGGGLLTLCPCSNMRSLSWETVLHKLLQCESFPPAAALHELPHGPSHRVQSFRNRLFQCGSSMGSQALPANLLQHGLLSPQVCRSCQEPAPVRAFHGVTASFGHPPAPAWDPSRAASGHLLHSGPPWAAGEQPDSPWSSSQGKISALVPGAPPPPPASLTLVSVELFLSHSLTPLSQLLLHSRFFPPSLICYHRVATTIAACLGLGQQRVRQSWLALALLGTGKASHSFS